MLVNYVLANSDQFIHDGDDAYTNDLSIDALVASGDCFITLATQLDAVAHDEQSVHQDPVVEEMVRTLIYLQRHYRVVKQQPNYRQ